MDCEIDKQDRVSHDDAGKGDPADHGSRCELCACKPVGWNDPEQCQWYRRHDDGRDTEILELDDDEKIYQCECNHEGGAHIAESLVGDSPLSCPLERRFGVVRGRAHPLDVIQQVLAIRSDIGPLFEDILNLHHAVNRRSESSADIGDNIFDSAQVLVIDDVIFFLFDKPAKFTQRDRDTFRCRDWQITESSDLRAVRKRQLQDDIDGFLARRLLDITQWLATQRHDQVLVDGFLGDPQQLRLVLVDFETPVGHVDHHEVVHIPQTFGF